MKEHTYFWGDADDQLDNISEIWIRRTEDPSEKIRRELARDNVRCILHFDFEGKLISDNDVAQTGEDVTMQMLQSQSPGAEHDINARSSQPSRNRQRNDVFLVAGRNDEANRGMSDFLSSIGLHVLEWQEMANATGVSQPSIVEILDAGFAMAGAIVVLFTPDDAVELDERLAHSGDQSYETEPSAQARPNALFEAGWAFGASRERTVFVELGKLRPFSDVVGLHVVRIGQSSTWRSHLADRLEIVGCEVDRRGERWRSAGSFPDM